MTAEDWQRFREVGGLRQFDPSYKPHSGLVRPDHEPGRDCPNAPHTCLICEPKVGKESTGPVEETGQDKCAIHDKYESIQGLYIQCFECRHVYMTEQDFVDAFNDITQQANDEYERAGMQSRAPLATTGEEVTFCGLCLHDI